MMAELRIATPRNMRASMAGTIDPSRDAVRTSRGLIAPSLRSCTSQSQIMIAPAIAMEAGGMNNDFRP